MAEAQIVNTVTLGSVLAKHGVSSHPADVSWDFQGFEGAVDDIRTTLTAGGDKVDLWSESGAGNLGAWRYMHYWCDEDSWLQVAGSLSNPTISLYVARRCPVVLSSRSVSPTPLANGTTPAPVPITQISAVHAGAAGGISPAAVRLLLLN